MTISQTLTAPPTPVPDKDSMTTAEFQVAADAYHAWTPTNISELTTWTSQTNALAVTVHGYKEDAQEALEDAQEQVALATAQAELATTNGAAQVALAQVSASSAALSANVSVYSSGVSYSAGQIVLDPEDQYTAYTSQAAVNQDHQPSTDDGTWWKPTIRPISTYSYDDRVILRSLDAKNQDMAIVDGLGFFVFETGSDEPDDDESCFATATGCWLLEAPHWDLIDAWNLPEVENNEARMLAVETNLPISILRGTATCAITTVATVTSTAFTGTVTGAAVGDRVIAVPPAALGTDAASTGRLSFHAFVSAENTVSIYLCNASAATATTNTAIRTAWPVTVIKEI